MLTNNNYNPDVLSCIANLSNDEVFTPPYLVNQILDLLPSDLWINKKATFLDPCCKSGVFLREIAKRLDKGLEEQIPERQNRMNHIFKKQLYGLAITELTALLSRRSVYCSKTANGQYSVCEIFNNNEGNIRFGQMEHSWENGRCHYCGANKENYERGGELENYAYSFIHADNPEEIFKMKFDVIIGNPPYQLSDGGGGNEIGAKPIYNLFVEQAKKMNPRYLTMIIPSRWYAGGKGLDKFRKEMLNDRRIRVLVDFPKSRDCFPSVDIAGGVCYFLWEKDYLGDCEVVSSNAGSITTHKRYLNEFDIFIRDSIGIGILHKVLSKSKAKLSEIVLTRNSFGFTTSDRGKEKPFKDSVKLVSSAGISYIKREAIGKNREIVDHYKVSIGTLNPDRGGVNNASDGKMNVTTKVKILFPDEVVTETYIVVNYFKTLIEAEHCAQYIKSRFVRFLISLTLSSMHIVRDNFQFVPNQDFTDLWTDERLNKMYNLTVDEIAYIESKIRPMDLIDE